MFIYNTTVSDEGQVYYWGLPKPPLLQAHPAGPVAEVVVLEFRVGPHVEGAQGAEVGDQVLGYLLVGDGGLVHGQVQDAVLGQPVPGLVELPVERLFVVAPVLDDDQFLGRGFGRFRDFDLSGFVGCFSAWHVAPHLVCVGR